MLKQILVASCIVANALTTGGCGSSFDCDVSDSFNDEVIPFVPSSDGIIHAPPGSGIPDVVQKPAPWNLTGNAYALLFSSDPDWVEENGFAPESLQGRYTGELSIVLVVDYKSSNVGPYGEMMYIPGTYQVRGKKCQSITKIYVTTWDSVLNGMENWGIPKERADMTFKKGRDGTEEFSAYKDGHRIAYFRMTHNPLLPVPAASQIVQEGMRTLAQHYDGKTYFYSPQFGGIATLGKLLQADFDPKYFPDVREQTLLGVIKLSGFKMLFPKAKIINGYD